MRRLQEKIQRAAACGRLLPLGRDRHYRRYWLLASADALFVEEDGFGLTEDMLQPATQTQTQTTARTREDQQVEDQEGKAEPAEGRLVSLPTTVLPLLVWCTTAFTVVNLH